MLKARDLNEGNRVMMGVEDHPVLRESILDAKTIYVIQMSNRTVYPIPITPKLLTERCGMSEGDGTFNSLAVPDGVITIIRAFIPNGGYVFCYQGVKIPLEGLHHLQNAFYTIFGYELEIIK